MYFKSLLWPLVNELQRNVLLRVETDLIELSKSIEQVR